MPTIAPSKDDVWISADNSQHRLEVCKTQNPQVYGIRDTSAQGSPNGGSERVVFATVQQAERALNQMRQLDQQQDGASQR